MIEFGEPWCLALLLLAVPVVWLGLRSLGTLHPVRRGIAIGVRCLLLLLLVLILSDVRTVRTQDRLTVLAVLDRSASIRAFGQVPPSTPDAAVVAGTAAAVDLWALDYLDAAASDRRPDDRLGLLTFDRQPTLRLKPAARDGLSDGGLGGAGGEGTDLARAITQALASKDDAETALRLVVVSDGNTTAGDTLGAARAAAAAGVPIDVLPIDYRLRDEVMVEGVYAPAEAREGQTVPVRVVLRATTPATGRVLLEQNGRAIDLNGDAPGTGVPVLRHQWIPRREAGPGGDTEGAGGDFLLAVTVDAPLPDAGPSSFTARFEAGTMEGGVTGDLVVNNVAEGFTQVVGPGKVLLVRETGPDARSGSQLEEALRRRGLEVEVRPPAALPGRLEALSAYDAVLMQNVPAEAVSPSLQEKIARYVTDLGGGFAMVGGPESFGAGGWNNSPIDRSVLAVACEIPSQVVLPSGALVMVIDRSGSMSAAVPPSPNTKQELVNEAAVLALSTLYPQDQVGLVAFDSAATWIVPLQENSDPAGVAKLARSIQPGGGTDIMSGLSAAVAALSNKRVASNAVRHVILLTDGNDGRSVSDYTQLTERMRDEGITLSTIGVGQDADPAFLSGLARLGEGDFHQISDPNNLPQVFIKEARTIRRNLIREGDFDPVVVPGAPLVEGLSGTPPLRGMIVTGQRRDRLTEVAIRSPDGSPVLATGQVGLGRSAAFTSDATDRWAARWIDWPGFGDFWSRLVRTIARPTASRSAGLVADVRDQTLRLKLDVPGADAAGFGSRAAVRGAVLRPDGSVQRVTLQQTAPGIYEASLPATQAGNYIASLFVEPPGGPPEAVFGGATRLPGRELRRFQPDRPLLERVAAITGGRVLDPADRPDPVADATEGLFHRDRPLETRARTPLRPWLLWLLPGLLLVDIVNRRIAWDPAWLRGLVTPTRRGEAADADAARTLGALRATRTRTVQAAMSRGATGVAERRFSASDAAGPVTVEQFDQAVGGATPTPDQAGPASGEAPSSTPVEEAGSTTSALLAAKRRARR